MCHNTVAFPSRHGRDLGTRSIDSFWGCICAVHGIGIEPGGCARFVCPIIDDIEDGRCCYRRCNRNARPFDERDILEVANAVGGTSCNQGLPRG